MCCYGENDAAGTDLRECHCCRNGVQIEPMGSLFSANKCIRDGTGAETTGHSEFLPKTKGPHRLVDVDHVSQHYYHDR